ncbi:MAG: Hsp20/alpha crystallin family protein [Nitrospiria bacterium]
MTIRSISPWRWERKTAPLNYFKRSNPVFPFFDTHFDQLFDDITQGFYPNTSLSKDDASFFNPRLNLVEKEKAFEVSVELPGLDEKDIELSIKEGVLTLRGEKKQEHEKEEEHVYHRECAYGSFLRSLRVPAEVEEDHVEAAFEKGVLKITLPKTVETEKTTHRIEVKAA